MRAKREGSRRKGERGGRETQGDDNKRDIQIVSIKEITGTRRDRNISFNLYFYFNCNNYLLYSSLFCMLDHEYHHLNHVSLFMFLKGS